MTIDDIIDGFTLLDDWEDRYRYLIELGRDLPAYPEEHRNAANKVEGCASQVWLHTRRQTANGETVLEFDGDSDAHLVRGLVAILLTLYSGKTPREIIATDAGSVLEKIGLRDHLTPQRSNGVRSMVGRIKAEAEGALAAA